MKTFKIDFQDGILKIGFGEPAQNPAILKELDEVLNIDPTVRVLKINGPASLPIAMWLAHTVSHIFGTIATYDPKLNGYVVVIDHSGEYKIGDVLK